MIESITLGTLSLTDADAAGALWGVQNLEGWGSVDATLAPLQRARQDGALAGDSYRAARSIVIDGETVFPDGVTALTAEDSLIAAASLTSTTLAIVEDGETRTALVRRDGPVSVKWSPGRERIVKWSVQLLAPDPRKFATALSATTALATTTGGLTYPYTYPYTIDATTVNGEVSLTNEGTVAGPVTLRVDGPCTGPVITHSPSGAVLSFASSFVLSTGEWLDIDVDRRTVLANGQSSRSKWLTSRGWSAFEPGGNTWAFEAASYDAGSRLTVTATPAWE